MNTTAILHMNSSVLNIPADHGHFEVSCPFASKKNLWRISISVFLIVMTVVGIVANLAVCYAVGKSVQLRKRTINWFIISLAMSDILTCSVQFPMRTNISFHNDMFCNGLGLCYLYILSDIWLTLSSVSSLFFISVFRFLAITNPLRYSADSSRKKSISTVAFCWIFSGFWSGLSIFKWETLKLSIHSSYGYCACRNPIYYTVSYILFIFFPLLAIGIMHVIAWKTLKKNNSQILGGAGGKRFQVLRRKQELKVTLSFILVYCSFMVCWLPLVFSVLIFTWCPPVTNE